MADDTARLRAEVESTRAELGETVEALATELSPRTQAQRKADQAKDKARTHWQRVQEAVQEDPRRAAGAGVAVVLLLVLRRRRRRR
jgi:MYXO-CTERM domain-containing protein